MTSVLVLYYSSYGHVEAMAYAEAEGVRAGGGDAVVKRVPELVPTDLARSKGFKLDQPAPVAEIGELPEYDAIIFGSPTRFGSVAAEMRSFLDQAGGLWAQGKLVGKVGAAFTSTATQHGGQEVDHSHIHPDIDAFRHGGCRFALHVPGANGLGRNYREPALWCCHHRRWRRETEAICRRA